MEISQADDMQPWAEFFKTDNLTCCPNTLNGLSQRVQDNVKYFQYNYMALLPGMLFLLGTSPLMWLIAIVVGILMVSYKACAKLPEKKYLLMIACITPSVLVFIFVTWDIIVFLVGMTMLLILIHAAIYKNPQNPSKDVDQVPYDIVCA